MKTVFSTSFEVAHLFANKLHTSARCANTSIDSWNDLWQYYSYRTVIGRHIENHKGETAVLLNDWSYSVTTSKHQRELREATSHLKQFFTSRVEIDRVHSRIHELIKDLVPKAKTRKQDYLNEARSLLQSFEEFNLWKYGKKSGLNWNKDTRYLDSKKLVAISDDAEKLAKYTAAELRAAEKARKAEQKRRAEEQARALAEYQIELKEWLNHERRSAPWKPMGANEDFLRLSKDGKNIETTQRVSIPVESARVLYKMILAGKDIKGYDLEGYTVIGLNGVLQIGCHKINVENMHEVGRSIIAD